MILQNIKNALNMIRADLSALIMTDEIIYDAQPIIDITKKIIILIEKHGIPDIEAMPVHKTAHVQSEYFNKLSSSLHRTLITVGRILDEITDNLNSSMNGYVDKLNEISVLVNDLELQVTDVEKKTLEKLTNKSIYDHEIIKIDFENHAANNGMTIVNKSLLLPVTQQTTIIPDDQTFAITDSQYAMAKLGKSIVATQEYTDEQIMQGTYFGNLIGLLDGSEDFQSESTFNILGLYSYDINDTLKVNYYSTKQNDKLRIRIDNKFANADGKFINMIAIKSNVLATTEYVENKETKNLQMINGIWPYPMRSSNVAVSFTQDISKRLRYQGLNLIDKNTGTIIKKYNYFTSLGYLMPETLKELNPSITVSDLSPTPQQELQIAERSGFFKYDIEVEQIGLFYNIYGDAGTWTSSAITTIDPISTVEIETTESVPGDMLDYIGYEVSFDNITWYPIRPTNVGITKFNKDKKKRIVLNNDNASEEYLYIGNKPNVLAMYLRINMQTDHTEFTPVIYEATLKIKTDRLD